MTAMEYEGFDRVKDRLFSVGDIIDRGPDSERCLKLLLEPWFYMIRGNHEEMLMNACGGDGEDYNWWGSYGAWAKRIDSEEMTAFAAGLKALPVTMTIDMGDYKVGLCHAEPDGRDWNAMKDNPRSEAVMIWGRRVLRNKPDYNVEGVEITIHGHTPLERPTWVGNRYFMDTGASESGVLTLRKIKDVFSDFSDRKTLWS